MSTYGSLSAPRCQTDLRLPKKVGEARDAVLAHMKGRDACKIAGRTYAHAREDGSVEVVLYETTIVKYAKNGSIVLNSGGHRTRTTKGMINMLLPKSWYVTTDGGVWSLCNGKGRYEAPAVVYPFADGITIHKNQKVTGSPPLKKVLAFKSAVRTYVEGYVTALLDGEIPAPSSADCWICGLAMPPAFGDPHVRLHVEERYYVPSLIVRACEAAYNGKIGYTERAVFAHLWGGGTQDDAAAAWFAREKSYARKRLIQILRRYVKRHVGLP